MIKDLLKMADARCPSHSGILVDICKGDKWLCADGAAALAVTYSYCVGGCGIFGDIIAREAAESFFAEVFDGLRLKGVDDFEFSCEDEKLAQWALSLFSEKGIQSEPELSYRYLKKDVAPAQSAESVGFSILPVDARLLGALDSYDNAGLLHERLLNSWERESFLRHSAGFVAAAKNRLIGVILGTGRYGEYLAIDIEVEKPFRRQGVAGALTNRFIADCLSRGIVPQWDCVESNIASQRLAEKSGFELFKKRPYYWFEL